MVPSLPRPGSCGHDSRLSNAGPGPGHPGTVRRAGRAGRDEQVIEGTLTVLVLYRATARLAGGPAGAVNALWLLPASGTGLPAWLKSALAGLTLAAVYCLAAATWRPVREACSEG
jgi:hypothetical protein